MSRRAAIILLTLFMVSLAQAQWRGPIVEPFGTEDGLDGRLRYIAQDSIGYLYFGHDRGLYQYDGESFYLHAHNPNDSTSISPGHVQEILVTRDGMVWLTVYQGDLNSFDPKSGKFRHYPLPEHELPKERVGVLSLCEGPEGDIWIGSYQYSLLHFDRETERFETYVPHWVDEGIMSRHTIGIREVLQDRFDPNILWITVHGDAAPEVENRYYGIFTFSKDTKTFNWHPCNLSVKYQDDDGKLWGIIWGSSVKSYDPQTQNCDTLTLFHLYPDEPSELGPLSLDITPYQDGFLLANRSVVQFDHSIGFSHFFQDDDPRSFTDLFIDNQSNVWLGHAEGVYAQSVKNREFRFFSLSTFGIEDRQYPAVLAYSEQQDAIYYPDLRSDREGKKLYKIPVLREREDEILIFDTDFHINTIAIDNADQIWVSGNGSFHLFDPVTENMDELDQPEMMPGTIPWFWNMQANQDDWLGAIGTKEFIWFHTDEQRLRRFDFRNTEGYKDLQNLDGFTFTPNGQALVWGHTIMILIDLETEELKVLEWPDDMKNTVYRTQFAVMSEDESIWVSCYNEVYHVQHSNGKLTLLDRISSGDGVAQTIAEMHVDNTGRVWLFSGSGIDGYDPKTGEIRHYGTQEGLPVSFNDPRQIIDLTHNKIATVSGNGIIVFDPEALWQSRKIKNVPIIVQEFRVNGEEYLMDTSINKVEYYQLPARNQVVDVQFQALAFPTNRKVEYSYRIDENDWIDIGTNKFVTLPDLAYGQTILDIRTGNGPSGNLLKRVVINKATPFYAQGWFAPLAILAIALGLFLLYKWRIRLVKRREAEKTRINKKLAELELTALRSQMNPHFMFNSLNSIKTYILEADPDTAADYLSQFAHLIRRILQNSREKLITLQEEIESLQLYINLEQFRFENAFEFDLDLDPSIETDEIMIPPLLLQPYVENAIWHGLMQKKQGGVLRLQFTEDDDFVYCTIDDNGVGRKKARELKSLSSKRHKSMGMGITANRVRILNQLESYRISIEIEDKTSGDVSLGTRVIAHIPKDLKTVKDETYE